MRATKNFWNSKLKPEVLSEKDIDMIINSAYELLHNPGIRFDPDPRVLDLFSAAGCHVSSQGVVSITRDLVENSIDSVEKEMTLWDRNGNWVDIPGMSFSSGMGCIKVVDMVTGESRSSTREDLATAARLVDALPNIDSICQPCKITERSDVHGEIDEFNVIASNTTKPIAYISEYVESLEAAIEIASAIRGGSDQLREKPYFSYGISQMPLQYSQKEIDQIFIGIENGIPLTSGTIAIGGATSPMTIAGSLAHCLATDFSLIVLGQLIKKGCHCLSTSELNFLDPKTGNFGGIPEVNLGELARLQIFSSMGLSAGSTGGSSSSPVFNQNCASDIASSIMHAFYSGADSTYYLGTIEALKTFSYQALLYCNELAGMIRRMERGIKVNEETLALDVSRKVGFKSTYLAEQHTARYCRTEIRQPRYYQCLSMEQWENEGKKDLLDKIDEDLKNTLAEHQPELLPDQVQQNIDPVLQKYGVIES
jgi:trimethylamine---corrinoid protein Co-methyltransferase